MAQPQLPLRTGLIGLSASAITSWAAAAHLPALIHPRGRELYTITALCNSSVDAAKAAIKAYELPETTKAYGTPAELADDGDVEVVICNTRVDKHYETVVGSVKKGKTVFVEWPVTSSISQTEELLELAKGSGSRVAVGLQRGWAPPVLRIREIIASGKWGKVLSSEVRAFGGTMGRDRMPVGLKYFGEKAVGGNPMTIGFAHLIDYIQSGLGDFVEGTTQAKTQLQRPKNEAFDPKTKEIVEVFESDVPDLIVVTGSLPASDTVAQDATLSVKFRRGPSFRDEPAFTWHINCEKGEIRLIAPSGPSLQVKTQADTLFHVHNFETDALEEETWAWSDEQEDIPLAARTNQRALYAFARGDEANYTTLEVAVKRARQIEAWLEKGSW